jgi:hypothetical protein
MPQVLRRTSRLPSLPKPPSIHVISQPEEMLSLIELYTSSSFRRPFIPIYQRPNSPNGDFRHSFNIPRKSGTSSRRMSSGLSQRKRDSVTSQNSISLLPDIQNRISITPNYKQYRQSFVTTN